MKKTLFTLLAITVIFGCSNSDKKVLHNNLYFSNDLESVKGWMEYNTLRQGNAHSGNYYSTTDSAWQFSQTFVLHAGEISAKPLKKVDVSVWANVSKDHFNGCIVTCITRNDSTIFWASSDLKNFYKKTGEWFQANASFNLPASIIQSDKVKIYVWNVDGKSEIKMDDMEIQFYN